MPESQASTSTLAAMLKPVEDAQLHAAAAPIADPAHAIAARINAALPQGAQPLTIKSLELHLIRAFSQVDLGSGPETVVIFEPEFLYVADVGLAARAGVLVSWDKGHGYGVPDFPDFASAKLRTVTGTQPSNLIFPLVAGEWIGALVPGTDPVGAEAAIEQAGAFDVRVSGTFVEGRCHPFKESEVCAALVAVLAILRYAEPNRIVRLIDFQPGWDARRIC